MSDDCPEYRIPQRERSRMTWDKTSPGRRRVVKRVHPNSPCQAPQTVEGGLERAKLPTASHPSPEACGTVLRLCLISSSPTVPVPGLCSTVLYSFFTGHAEPAATTLSLVCLASAHWDFSAGAFYEFPDTSSVRFSRGIFRFITRVSDNGCRQCLADRNQTRCASSAAGSAE